MRARPIAFTSDDLRLTGELVAPEGPRSLIVLCRGTPSGHPPDPEDPGYPGLARDLAGAGHAAFWFNFRGCYDAPGDLSADGWVRDLTGALDSLGTRPEVAGAPVILLGSSAGGGTAITAAAARSDVTAVATFAAVSSWTFGDLVEDWDALIQEFRNAGSIRDPAFPPDRHAWIAGFSATAAEDHVASLAPRPLLLVHGDADAVVPYPHAERLFERAAAPKELVRIPGAGHQLRRDPRAIEAFLDWLDAVLRPR